MTPLKKNNPRSDNYVFDKDLEEVVEDQIGVRSFEHPDGRKFVVRCKDPYGHWHISPRKGPVPAALKGAYTSVLDAELAIQRYCSNHPK